MFHISFFCTCHLLGEPFTKKKQQINEASNKAVNMIPFIPNCDYVDEKEIMFNIGILAKSLRQERAINSTRRENR